MSKKTLAAASAEADDSSSILKDERFVHLVRDPRFKEITKNERKVQIDKRFQPMFEDPKFKVKYTHDKYGRKANKTSTEDLKKFYELKDEEEDAEAEDAGKEDEHSSADEGDENDSLAVDGTIEKKLKTRLKDLDIDYARGEGLILTDSSSDDESESEDDEENAGLVIDHVWGELDRDAPLTEESSRRLAVCNMDWDKIRAEDIMVLCNSFLPPNSAILSVAIYPSEFGKERMKEEEQRGPSELVNKNSSSKKNNSEEEEDSDEEDIDADGGAHKNGARNGEEAAEGDEYHMEKLRQYQLNRLKYYYAVIDCDRVATADKLYAECDGLEYESSAATLDLRFVPDDMEFEDEPREICTQLPDLGKYQPRLFKTTALQNAKVELTWDETNEDRKEFTEKMMEGKLNEISDVELKKYLAYSSDEDEEVNKKAASDKNKSKVEQREVAGSSDEESDNDQSTLEKYKNLLNEIKDEEDKKRNRNVEMEFSWDVGAQEKVNTASEEVPRPSQALTPFEKLIEKRQKKKELKQKKRKPSKVDESKLADSDDEDVPDGIDMNDSYFAEEFASGDFVPNKSKSGKKKLDRIQRDEEEKEASRKQAELALLLEDEEDQQKSHFSLKKIQSAENESAAKSKRKRKRLLKKSKQEIAEAKSNKVQDGFKIDLKDSRFDAIYTSHLYNIDPTDSHFKKTSAMDEIIAEKLQRKRPTDNAEVADADGETAKRCKTEDLEKTKTNMLIKNIKRKIKK